MSKFGDVEIWRDALLDNSDNVAAADRVARLYPDLDDRARGLGGDVVLHLHRLEHAEIGRAHV